MSVDAKELQHYIERVESLEEQKKGLADDAKAVLEEAENKGFDKKAIKEIVKLRKKDPQDRQEEENVLDVYKNALGM